MRLLVLGGSEFVGTAFVESALARGWQVTTLNRGHRAVLPGVDARFGDRSAPGGLAALGTDRWDFVVDTWSWAPIAVREAANELRGRASRYLYVSSTSVYSYPRAAGGAEDASLGEGSADDETFEDYARTKRGGELAALAAFGDRTVIARPGLILGPHENIGRLPWWLGRMHRGGVTLAPGPADGGIQYIDARDLADWGLRALETGAGGAFNLVSPVGHATFAEFLNACMVTTGSDAELRWVTPEVVLAANIAPWMQLPVWVPPGPLHETLHQTDVSAALASGLRIRPLAETVGDTWAWLQSIGGIAPQRSDRPQLGLDPDVERGTLAGAEARG